MSEQFDLSADTIRRLFDLLDGELRSMGVVGEVHLVGGAVMCLVFDARPSTRDVNAWFHPATELREAAGRVAAVAGVPEGWLNDGAKGFLGSRAEFEPYLDLPNLRLFTAVPAYLLAMKCLAMRIGKGFRDEEDVRFLLRVLNIERYEDAVELVLSYFEEDRIPPKTWLALEEILRGD